LKADVIIFLSSSQAVLMQVHLDAPQADLNAWGTREEQDLYQSHFELEKRINIMICISIYADRLRDGHVGSCGFPNVGGVCVRISENSYSFREQFVSLLIIER
jgi:hypothetical protein